MSVAAAAHVACAPLAEVLQDMPPAQHWFTPSERARDAATTSARRREQFRAGHWQARWLLAQVLGGSPMDWALSTARDAPPVVEARSGLCLSISHSASWTACAVAEVAIGIDIEVPLRRRDIPGLIELCCTPSEQRLFDAITGQSEGEHGALFHELWTVKEAWLKRRREWLSPRRLRELQAAPRDGGEQRTWRGEGWHLALSAPPRLAVQWYTAQATPSRCWQVVDTAARVLRPA